MRPAVPQWAAQTPWLVHYPAGVPAHLEYPREPVWRLLENTAAKHGERVACRYFQQHLSYAQLWQAARGTAARLAALGIAPGDRVGVLLPNCPEYLASVYGIWLAGGTVVSLSPLMVSEEIAALLQATDCRIVIALDLLARLVHGEQGDAPDTVLLATLQDRLPFWRRWGYRLARVKRGTWRSSHRTTSFSCTRAMAETSPPVPRDHAPDQPAYILCTGGTTAAPKAVVLSHGNLVANAWQLLHWANRYQAEQTVLAVLPFFHSYGLSTCVTASVAMAATLILHHRFEPQTVIRLIEQHRPTIFYAVPTMLVMLNDRLRAAPADLGSLQCCISGGAALDPAVAEEFAAHSGALVVEGYGLSEAGPVTHVNPLDGNARPGSIGLPLPDTEAKIVDLKDGEHPLPPGEVGELVLRGPQVMAGYWNNPEETARVLRGGWLYTGDVAACDADGFFRIMGRKKDLILTSGFSVYPADVEHVLRQCPGVSDAAVVGVPDPQRGEIVKAVLVLKKGQRFDRRAFDAFVEEHLAKPKRPRIVELADDLPRNFLGKVLRRKLREPGRELIEQAQTEETA